MATPPSSKRIKLFDESKNNDSIADKLASPTSSLENDDELPPIEESLPKEPYHSPTQSSGAVGKSEPPKPVEEPSAPNEASEASQTQPNQAQNIPKKNKRNTVSGTFTPLSLP